MKSALCLLLLALCCLGTWGQTPRPEPGHSLEEFPFQTRRQDSCIMHTSLSGQGAGAIRLRVDCLGHHEVYWCEWSGQPDKCPAFVANPKLYWTQVLQQLRDLDHACQEAPVLKPSVCRQAGPQAHLQQMASSLQSIPAPSQQPQTAKAKKPSQKPAANVEPMSAAQLGNAVSSPQSTVKANQPEFRGNKEAEKMTRELFWEPLRAVLAFLISLFRG